MTELFIIFAAVALIVYVSQKHKERMTLIKKGEHAGKVQFKDNKSELFTVGLFLVGIALGFIVGSIVAKTGVLNSDISYVSMIMLFGGLALLINNLVQKKEAKDELDSADKKQ